MLLVVYLQNLENIIIVLMSIVLFQNMSLPLTDVFLFTCLHPLGIPNDLLKGETE